MTLSKRIADQLGKAPPEQIGAIQAVEDEVLVHLKLADWDRLGCILERVELKNTHGNALGLDPFRIEEKVTYLGETLRVIETEKERGRHILRSASPRKDEEVISFFEMVLDENEGLSLVRYAYDRRLGERAPVPTTLTRDCLKRLLDDLIELFQEN
jgi:hypothetical protein